VDRPLYLVRHAEVLLRGDVPMTAWQLSPTGEQQARHLARSPVWRELTLIASSPESKAVATAQPIAEAAALDLRIEPDLHEVDRGVTPLVPRSEYDGLVAAHFASPGESVGGWEPAVEAARRTVECIERLAASAPGALCIVSHGLVLSHFLAHLRDLPAPDVDEWRAIPLPAVAVVDAGSWTEVAPFVSLLEFMGLA
jgi:broad specificity phosphatase PhoE